MRKNVFIVSVAFLFAMTVSAEVIRRGDTVRDVEPTPLTDILTDPAKYEGNPVVTNGIVSRACRKKGCWMELSDAKAGKAMRVSFKDYGFFVPLDSQGSTARLDGTVTVKQLSKAEADHYEDDGGTIARNDDGSAIEISFVASGVELIRPDPS